MIEQYDVDDIKIRSKYLDLRLRPESMVITRMFSGDMNFPFVAFVVEDDQIVLSPPKKIRVQDNTVYFDAEKLSGSISLSLDSLLFQAQAYGSRIGIMWPNHRSSCYFADEMLPIDKRFTTVGKFKSPGNDPTSININVPVICMKDKTCLMVHSQLQNPIEFCFFYHNLMPYWNAITNDVIQIAFRPCSSKRDGLSAYYDRYGTPNPTTIGGHSGIEQMKRCLYNNQPITIPNTEISLRHPKSLQKTLDHHKVKNCIIGSLAMSLHGFPVEVKDFDVVVDSLDNVRELTKKLFEEDLEVSEALKWSHCGARLTLNPEKDCHVDLVELPRFDWNQVEKIQELNVVSISGLLLMKLVGEYERTQMEPSYDNFRQKNYANIDLLLKESPFVYPFFDDFLRMHSMENYMLLQNYLRGAVRDSVSMNINDPLIANVFLKGSITLLPVINNGSETPARIHLQRQINSARWFQIGRNSVDCKVSTHSEWSTVSIPMVESFGILVCKNA